MKKTILISLVAVLVLCAALAGCAPSQPAAVEEPAEAPTEETGTILAGTKWEAEIPGDVNMYYALDFGADGKVTEYLSDAQNAATYEEDGNGVKIHRDGMTMLATIDGDKMQVLGIEGLDDEEVTLDKVDVLSINTQGDPTMLMEGTKWETFIPGDTDTYYALDFGPNGQVTEYISDAQNEATYEEDGAGVKISRDGMTMLASIEGDKMQVFGVEGMDDDTEVILDRVTELSANPLEDTPMPTATPTAKPAATKTAAAKPAEEPVTTQEAEKEPASESGSILAGTKWEGEIPGDVNTYVAFKFGSNGNVTVYIADAQGAGTYDEDGNGAKVHMDGNTMFCIIDGGTMSVTGVPGEDGTVTLSVVG